MAAATMYVTVAGAGDKSGSTWGNAMGLAEWETDVEGSAEAGDIYYVEEGTYTLTGGWLTALDGTTVLPIKVTGVKSGTSNEPPVLSDYADDTARPLIAAAANTFEFDNYWIVQNIRVTITQASGLVFGLGPVVQNVAVNNSGAGGALSITTGNGRAIGCDLQAAGSTAVSCGSNSKVVACYLHDSSKGVSLSGPSYIVNCIIDTCSSRGIDIGSRSNSLVVGNTIYNCGIAIYGTTATNCLALNNIIDGNTTGVEWTTQTWSNWFDYNCWDNTDDVVDTDIEQGVHKVTGDPGMSDPGAGNFSVQTGDNVADAAIDAGDKTGATV